MPRRDNENDNFNLINDDEQNNGPVNENENQNNELNNNNPINNNNGEIVQNNDENNIVNDNNGNIINANEQNRQEIQEVRREPGGPQQGNPEGPQQGNQENQQQGQPENQQQGQPENQQQRQPEVQQEPEPFLFGDEDELEDRPEDDLQRRREALQERRRQLEQEEAEYQRDRNRLNQAEQDRQRQNPQNQNQPNQNHPVPNPQNQNPQNQAQPNQNPQNQANRNNPQAANNRARRKFKNPFKGTVNAQNDIDGELLDKQRKNVRSLRAMMKVVTDGEKRPEFLALKKQLLTLEVFLLKNAGRKKLSKKEMEVYELLTMRVHKATERYDEAMAREEAALKQNGKKLSKKDIKRLNAMERIRQNISQMRSDMYDKDMVRKKEEMQKQCEEKLQNMKETLDGLNYARYKDDQLKEILTGAVSRTLFFMNRMTSLEKNIQLKPGESMKKNTRRLDRDIRPSRQDLDNTARMELTKSIVDEGMKTIKAGKTFSTDDIERLQKQYIRNRARRLAEERRRNNQNPQNQNLQNQNLQNRNPNPAPANQHHL